MQRFTGLFRDTWWLWLGLCTVGTLLALFFSRIFWVTYLISAFSFIYFAMLRYDEDGRPKERL